MKSKLQKLNKLTLKYICPLCCSSEFILIINSPITGKSWAYIILRRPLQYYNKQRYLVPLIYGLNSASEDNHSSGTDPKYLKERGKEGSWYPLELQNQLKTFPKCCKLFLWCFSKRGGREGWLAIQSTLLKSALYVMV